MPTTEFDHRKAVGLLRKHAAGHDNVRPMEVRLSQLPGIAVNEAHLPVRRQQGGDGYEAERCGRITGTHELARFREIPECFRSESRINQKHAASMLGLHQLSPSHLFVT